MQRRKNQRSTIHAARNGASQLLTHRGVRVGALLCAAALLGSLLVTGTTGLFTEEASASPGDISTAAGTGVPGYSGDGGPAASARLRNPYAVAVDGAGNTYIADTLNHRVRKVNVSGTISTVAGIGSPGFSGDGGPASSAQLQEPSGLAVDGSGNVYIADLDNHRIRRVDTSGTISTVSGSGAPGYGGDGGPASVASLYRPRSVAVDGVGNLYIADGSNHRIRKVDASGTISSVAGTGADGYSGDGGPATAAQLYYPHGVALDGRGNLYIADSFNSRIRKVDTSGVISTVAGTGSPGSLGDGGPAIAAQLQHPRGLVVDSAGNLYIADTLNHRIRKVDTLGVISTVVGTGSYGFSGDGGPATSSQLNSPLGVVADGAGNLYIADTYNHRIRKVQTSPPLTPVTTTSVPSVTTTSIPLPTGGVYPSNECAGGTNVVDGFFGDSYLKLRTNPDPQNATTTWVCAAVDSGTAHVGGKLRIAGATPNTTLIDDNQEACDANPGSRIQDQESFVGPIAFDIDVNVDPNATDAVWVCFNATDSLDDSMIVAKRIVVSTPTAGAGTGFDADAPAPAVYVERPNPGVASSTCQAAATTTGKTRLVNADIGTAHVWLYTLAENGGTRQNVCLRAQNPSVNPTAVAGGRLTADGNGGQTFLTARPADPATDFGVCDIPIFGLNQPHVFLKAHAGAPSYGCVGLLGASTLITVTTSGGQSIATFTED